MTDTTATELYHNLLTVLTDHQMTPAIKNKVMHETLILICAYGLRNSHFAFGDLNAQTERLILQLSISEAEANAIRQARRDTNRSKPLDEETLRYDVRALATFVSRVFRTSIPGDLSVLLPHDAFENEKNRLRNDHIHANAPDKRCIVKSWDEHTINVIVDEDGADTIYTVNYTEARQYAHMDYLYPLLHEGMHLNLLDCEVKGTNITPRLIIVEPDCLMDISTIAACFEEYGHHPLLYFINRLKPKANSQEILLGNYAGCALDDTINDPQASMGKSLKRSFREKALEYVACPDFDAVKFKNDAARQTDNLKDIVDELRRHYDMKKAIVEPTFICEKLGLQGRVDLMTTDLKLLVEQKSGRNYFIERNFNNSHGNKVVEKHYVQLLLYFGILYFNFHEQHTSINLLYSKFGLPDGLVNVANLRQLVYEALRFRNEAIAIEFEIATKGLRDILPQLTEQTLNVAHSSGFFYDNYLRPQLVNLLSPLQQLHGIERDYFCRMTQFVIRENLLSKVGVADVVGNNMASLWNMPLAEKKETGSIYTDLQLMSTQGGSPISSDTPSVTTLLFSIPEQGEDFLPNFRRGDSVFLYAYPTNEEPDVRKALLFKGTIDELHADRLTVVLADGQQNADIFNHLPYDGHLLAPAKSPVAKSPATLSSSPSSYPAFSASSAYSSYSAYPASSAHPASPFSWCIEHAGSDVGGSANLRALYELVTAPQDRKDLLLGQRPPSADKSRQLSKSYLPTLDNLLLRAKQANDFFLIVGPPGTGKTSMALQYIVREAFADNPQPSLLLMSYTNRAVDEICGMLEDNGFDYIRIGHELSCAPAYAAHLLSQKIGTSPKLNDMRQLLHDTHIVVGTTSMIQARAYLFDIMHFSLAVIDEASQILEPNIIGLLASHRGNSGPQYSHSCDIDKFILIGDYKQLPAVVQQNDADSAVSEPSLCAIGLTDCKNSLFERLIRQEQRAGRTDFIGTLHYQGRMHPDIADFPNQTFYFAEHLEPVPLPHQRATDLGYTLPSQDATDDLLKAHRLLFLASTNCQQPEVSDKVNISEAHIVADMIRRIHRFYGQAFNPNKTVGVIVPYRNQIALIRKEIEQLGLPELEDISIDTVERYQGSQRDVIIYSFTIQRQYQLSFLASNTFEESGHLIDRKLNVALTRARKQLILTGNPHTLAANPVFAELMQYIRNKGGYVG